MRCWQQYLNPGSSKFMTTMWGHKGAVVRPLSMRSTKTSSMGAKGIVKAVTITVLSGKAADARMSPKLTGGWVVAFARMKFSGMLLFPAVDRFRRKQRQPEYCLLYGFARLKEEGWCISVEGSQWGGQVTHSRWQTGRAFGQA